MFLLTGAAGRTGKQILGALAAMEQPVRAFIRDPKKAEMMQRLGAQDVFIGDLEDPKSISQAVTGCDAVLHIGPPMHPQEVQITEILLNAAVQSGVQKFVYYSVMHPLRREVRHHRLKLDAEEKVIESGLRYTILQPARYMQHLEGIWPRVLTDHVHAMPFNVDVKFNVVDLADLAAATATVAASADHDYATYELAGPEALSQSDMASIISDVLGKSVVAAAVTIADMEAKALKAGLSADRISQMRVMNEHYDKYGFLGNSNVLKWIVGRPLSTFRQYVERLVKTNM